MPVIYTICNRTVLDNPKLLQMAEERKTFRNIQFYENAVEEANLDLLKCDPSNTEFIKAIIRAQDNCILAYQAVQDKLHTTHQRRPKRSKTTKPRIRPCNKT